MTCSLLGAPAPLAEAVARAHGGAWLPQELLARRETLRRAQAHLSQQVERLTDAYLRAVLPLDEYERRRRDLEQRMQALAGQEELLRHDAQRQQQLAGIAASLEAFRERVQHGLANATFEQRRQLILLLVDRVVVTNDEVEIRYVLPTHRESEHVRFCQLRKDYFNNPSACPLTLAFPLTHFLSPATNMNPIAALRCLVPRARVIIAEVETQMLHHGCSRGAPSHQAVERLSQEPVVIAIGRPDHEA